LCLRSFICARVGLRPVGHVEKCLLMKSGQIAGFEALTTYVSVHNAHDIRGTQGTE
jgi:hypothetical protein